MKVPIDFADMLQALNDNDAQFMIVGAFAMAHFGYIRATGDIDIFIAPTMENSPRIFNALRQFGAPPIGAEISYFATEGNFLQIGNAPLRIDLITKIDGIKFEDAVQSAETVKMGDIEVKVLSLADLIRNKATAARTKDLADAEELRRIEKMINNERKKAKTEL